MTTPALNDLLRKTKAEIQPNAELKFIEVDTVLTILIYQGLKILLPELREWIKLGFSKIVLKRIEIEKRLKDYALEKELDFKSAEKSAQKIAQNINEENIKTIIQDLEQSE
jgi:hypothetical protein